MLKRYLKSEHTDKQTDGQTYRQTDILTYRKLDGEGPIDNRPSTDKLNHFVQKKNATSDM